MLKPSVEADVDFGLSIHFRTDMPQVVSKMEDYDADRNQENSIIGEIQ